MGLLTILKKMKQKERELRLLMLYPPGAAGAAGPAGRAVSGAPYRARRGRTNCPLCVTTWAGRSLPIGGRGPGPGRGGTDHRAGAGGGGRPAPEPAGSEVRDLRAGGRSTAKAKAARCPRGGGGGTCG